MPIVDATAEAGGGFPETMGDEGSPRGDSKEESKQEKVFTANMTFYAGTGKVKHEHSRIAVNNKQELRDKPWSAACDASPPTVTTSRG